MMMRILRICLAGIGVVGGLTRRGMARIWWAVVGVKKSKLSGIGEAERVQTH
jgi:hypothetical protein